MDEQEAVGQVVAMHHRLAARIAAKLGPDHLGGHRFCVFCRRMGYSASVANPDRF